ncbi:hypothetical protein LJB88_02085 [Erysipelotrichaceae bacterium OttesenSCG-928-M19]|nr:hypothetical protein [Erysipelotrichaceae bacterium OttesenSCG-928-M19]
MSKNNSELVDDKLDVIDFGINPELIKQRLELPIFAYHLANVQRGEKEGNFAPMLDLYEYLFGVEKTKELFEKFKTFDELNDFLGKYMK